jgi:(p)ppGpp synthase/HD superfamily hydrolase
MIASSAILPDSPEAFQPRTPKIARALELAHWAHQGQRRVSGEPYVTHVVSVASILESWGITDERVICAALLHDAIEDNTQVDKDYITHWFGAEQSQFGAEVADLVQGVSKLRSRSGEVNQFETLRNVVLHTYLDPRVGLLKLTDRYHNMLTLDAMQPEKQLYKSHETLSVYARLAESLGLWVVKRSLEDMAFAYFDPDGWRWLETHIQKDQRLSARFISGWKQDLESLLAASGITGQVEVRRKGRYELFEKWRRAARQGLSWASNFRDINDVISFRVLAASEDDCYRFLGVLRSAHQGSIDFSRSDDFIMVERDNHYSALQDTLRLPEGDIEVAITTTAREEINNWGLVSLMRQQIDNLSLYALKLVFTPREEVYFLPPEATGNDYAAAINPELLLKGLYLWVDGERRPMSTVLPNGAKVKVETGESRRLFEAVDLRHCAMRRTRQLIEKQLRWQEWDQMVIIGKARLEAVLGTSGLLDLSDLQEIDSKRIGELCSYFGCEQLDDLYFRIGRENTGTLDRVIVQMRHLGIDKDRLNLSTIRLKGIDQPGVLAIVSVIIAQHRGNIRTVVNTMRGRTYILRLVIEGLTPADEAAIAEELNNSDLMFTEVVVV